MRALLNRVATRLKGAPYALDPAVPLQALMALALRRAVWALRGRWNFPFSRHAIFVAPGAVLRNRSFIQLGQGCTIGQGAFIDGLSTQGVRLGANVNIGPHTLIQATCVLSRLGTGCSIGPNSGIGGFSFIGCGGGVTIGANVIMGQYVSFHAENHHSESTDIPIRLQGVDRKGILIEDDVWVGAKVTFLDGCHVGTGCVVAAGSVVRGTIAPFSVVAGVPARVIRSRRVGEAPAAESDG